MEQRNRLSVSLGVERMEERDVPAVVNAGDPGQVRDASYPVPRLTPQPQWFRGAMERTNDVDLYAVDLKAGQALVIGLDDTWNRKAGPQRAGLQAVVTVFTDAGNYMTGAGTNPDLVLSHVSKDTRLYVGVSHAGNNHYRITNRTGMVSPPDAKTGTYQVSFGLSLKKVTVAPINATVNSSGSVRDWFGFYDYVVTFRIPKNATDWSIRATSTPAQKTLDYSRDSGGWPNGNPKFEYIDGDHRVLIYTAGYNARKAGGFYDANSAWVWANNLKIDYRI